MADLTATDRAILEWFFEMAGGYVLDFSNRTIAGFIADSTGKDIDDPTSYGEGSKANRLRVFWRKETNEIVGKLIRDMVDYQKERKRYDGMPPVKWDDAELYLCIANRLCPPIESITEHLEALKPEADDPDGHILFQQIRISIGNGHEEGALDRLHPWLIKYYERP